MTTRKTKDYNVDRHIGRCLRYFRTLRGATQSDLAKKLDITFQQLQKYEKGISSVSSTMLYKISIILMCNVYDFLPNLNDNNINEREFEKYLVAESARGNVGNPFANGSTGDMSNSSHQNHDADVRDIKYLVRSFTMLDTEKQKMICSFMETLIKEKRKTAEMH